MTIKVGTIVSHENAMEWGVGKVLEVTSTLVLIQFSDGKNRKIANSHFCSLKPASADLYVPPSPAIPAAKVPRSPGKAKKKK